MKFGHMSAGSSSANIAKGMDRTRIGDQWTFVAIDPDTKLVPAYLRRQAHP